MFLNERVVDLMLTGYLHGLRHRAGTGYCADEELGGGGLVLVLGEARGVLFWGCAGCACGCVEFGLEVGEGLFFSRVGFSFGGLCVGLCSCV